MIKLQDIFPASAKPVDRILTGMLALVAFFLPFKFLVNGFIVVAFVVWLFNNPFPKLFTKNRFIWLLCGMVIFYLLHAIAFAYTENVQEGFFSLEVKISMLIFPLIFYTGNYSWPQMKFFLMNFILGNIICCVACLVHAAWLGGGDQFFYERLSWFQHPSYFSMYLTFCCVVMLQKNIFSNWMNALLLLFFTVFILLLSSKTGIAIHFLFLLMVGVSYFLKKRNFLRMAVFSFVSVIAVILLVWLVPPVKQRFQNVIGAFNTESIDKSATESTAVRILIWKEAKGIISEHPLLGVSPGDANDALYERYKQNGLTGAYEKKLNAHNQYYQTGVGLGLLGLASILCLFMLPLFLKPRRLLVFFLLIVAVNFLTESMLQTMAGCIFFGYFYALLCFDHDAYEPKYAKQN